MSSHPCLALSQFIPRTWMRRQSMQVLTAAPHHVLTRTSETRMQPTREDLAGELMEEARVDRCTNACDEDLSLHQRGREGCPARAACW